MSSKLREALSKASIALSWASHHHLTEDDAKECLEVVDAALSAPPRNCDRFKGFKDAEEAYCKEVEKVVIWDGWHCERLIKWLFAEAKGGAE